MTASNASLSPRLGLVVPGLIGPWPELAIAAPNAPTLRRWLGRSEPLAFVPGFEATLAALLTPAAAPPLAPLMARRDGLAVEQGYWLRADPVYCHTDAQQSLLTDPWSLRLTQAEADAIAAAFNDQLGSASDPTQPKLFAPQPTRLYLRWPTPLALQTTPLSAMINQPLQAGLPQGDDARQLVGLMTEVQMLLFGLAINQQRQASGQWPINSLWFWGEGEALPPPASPPTAWSSLYSEGGDEEITAAALAEWRQLTVAAASDPAITLAAARDDLAAGRNALIVCHGPWYPWRGGDSEGWAAAVARFEQQWLAPLAKMRLPAGTTIELYPCSGRAFRLTPAHRRRFWRRSPPLQQWWLSAPPHSPP